MARDLGAVPAEVIEAYSRDLDERIEFLDHLYQERKKKEALTLCCVYIESLAQQLYFSQGDKADRSKRNFVKAVLEFGDNNLSLIHLQSLSEALKGCGHAEIEKTMGLQVSDRLSTEEEILEEVVSSLGSEQLEILKDSIWHGTVAAQMYRRFRNPLVHGMHATDGVILGGVTFRGFEVLYPVLQRIAMEWKNRLTSAQSSVSS